MEDQTHLYVYMDHLVMSRLMCLRITGMTMSGELKCGKWPVVGIISITDGPPRCWCIYSDTSAGTMSMALCTMWQGTFTIGKTCLTSHWNFSWVKLKAISGLMLNRVREISWTSVESMSPPTTIGAKPERHALKLERIPSSIWSRSASSNPPW